MNTMKGFTFKPNRILYYIETSQEHIDNYYKGIVPECLMEFDGAFGTYDCPALYHIKRDGLDIRVLGIEFRPSDARVDYPKNMKSMVLPASAMVVETIYDEYSINDEIASEFVRTYDKADFQTAFEGERVYPKDDPDVVQIHIARGNIRILIASDVVDNSITGESMQISSMIEEKLYNQVYHDSVTGHYNWNYLWPIISRYYLKDIQDFTFVHFNVKDFKSVNVVYGHIAGNNVLSMIVDQMNKQDWIYYSARCDNDNFAMMIKDMPEEETRQKLEDFFEKISRLEEDPAYRIYYRCGVVPMKSTLMLGTMVADAGKQAQACGQKSYETEIIFFTDKMRDDQEWSIRIRTYLDKAIENDEFLIFLQPKYEIQSGKCHGAEALIRWKYKGKELLPPFRFIPIFETGGLISKLDDIVLKKVCECIKRWEKEGKELVPISVNVSRKSMGDPNLVDHLTEIVDSYEVNHELIDFELTESAAYENLEYMIEVIKALKSRNFKISMDDFGTGYSSLSLLYKMPFDTLKIDKSFVDGIGLSGECQKSCSVIKHMISMAQELRLTCLAEGVEEKEQVDLLRLFGCEVIQGYYYSKPLPVDEFEEKVFNNK